MQMSYLHLPTRYPSNRFRISLVKYVFGVAHDGLDRTSGYVFAKRLCYVNKISLVVFAMSL